MRAWLCVSAASGLVWTLVGGLWGDAVIHRFQRAAIKS